MRAARPHTDPEVAEASPGPSPKRRRRDDDGGPETEESQQKCRRTTASAALSGSSSVDEEELRVVGAEDTASEDASYVSLDETRFLRVHRENYLTEHPLRVPKTHEIQM